MDLITLTIKFLRVLYKGYCTAVNCFLILPGENKILQGAGAGSLPFINKNRVPGDLGPLLSRGRNGLGIGFKPVVFEEAQAQGFVLVEQHSCETGKEEGEEGGKRHHKYGTDKGKESEAGIVKKDDKTLLEGLGEFGLKPGTDGKEELEGKKGNHHSPEDQRGQKEADEAVQLKVEGDHHGDHGKDKESQASHHEARGPGGFEIVKKFPEAEAAVVGNGFEAEGRGRQIYAA